MRTGATLMTQETPMTDSSGAAHQICGCFQQFMSRKPALPRPRQDLRLNLEIWIKKRCFWRFPPKKHWSIHFAMGIRPSQSGDITNKNVTFIEWQMAFISTNSRLRRLLMRICVGYVCLKNIGDPYRWMPNIFQYITHFLLISCASMFQFQFNGCHPQLPFSFHLQLKTFGDGENELSILQAAAFWRRGI